MFECSHLQSEDSEAEAINNEIRARSPTAHPSLSLLQQCLQRRRQDWAHHIYCVYDRISRTRNQRSGSVKDVVWWILFCYSSLYRELSIQREEHKFTEHTALYPHHTTHTMPSPHTDQWWMCLVEVLLLQSQSLHHRKTKGQDWEQPVVTIRTMSIRSGQKDELSWKWTDRRLSSITLWIRLWEVVLCSKREACFGGTCQSLTRACV